MTFVDRSAITQCIGLRSAAAIFKIYLFCLEELVKWQVIYPPQQPLTLQKLEMIGFIENKVSKLSFLWVTFQRRSKASMASSWGNSFFWLIHCMSRLHQAFSLAVDKQSEETQEAFSLHLVLGFPFYSFIVESTQIVSNTTCLTTATTLEILSIKICLDLPTSQKPTTPTFVISIIFTLV